MTKRPIRLRSAIFLIAGVALAAWAAAHGEKSWSAPEEAKKLKNPVATSEATLAAAKAIYMDNCAQCHGEQGKGDGPDAPLYAVVPTNFTDAHMMGEMTDGEIFWKVSEGRRPMPSFKKRLTEEQRWQVVNYLRTFAPKPAPASNPPARKKAAHPKH